MKHQSRTIGVVGTNTWNKGMELMQVGICEHLQSDRTLRLAVPPLFGTFEDRARYGLRCLQGPLKRKGKGWLAMQILPKGMQDAFGIVQEKDLAVMLEASGFAFGDQHPVERTFRLAQDVSRWKRLGIPVILLPQALGPFDKPGMRDAFATAVAGSDIVYAREPISLEHARNACPSAENIRLAPDFTNLVKPLSREEVGSIARACIVPNQRMIEKATERAQIDGYLPLLAAAVEDVARHGLEPVLLIHGSEDRPLVQALQKCVGRELSVISERDAVGIKAELGRSQLVIASRFHALVSALSQGVPAIATSWSHKYEMLFEDYGCRELVLPVPAGRGQIEAAVSACTGEAGTALKAQLLERCKVQEDRAIAMWREVDAILGLAGSN